MWRWTQSMGTFCRIKNFNQVHVHAMLSIVWNLKYSYFFIWLQILKFTTQKWFFFLIIDFSLSSEKVISKGSYPHLTSWAGKVSTKVLFSLANGGTRNHHPYNVHEIPHQLCRLGDPIVNYVWVQVSFSDRVFNQLRLNLF